MIRLALIALGVVLALLLALSLRGGDAPAPVAAAELVLHDARVTLHPQSDPDAVWTFAAPEVRHDPARDLTTLLRVDDGARVVDGETDFTVASDELVIDASDDLRGDAITAVVLPEGDEGDTRLEMTGSGDRQVLIDQAEGRFSVPHLELTGEGYESVLENVSVAFDLQDFQAGGPGTIGVGRFEVAVDGEDRSE